MKIGKVVVQIEANRPWRDGKRAGPKRREPHAPPSAGKQAEIEKCLACSRPDCQGSCPPGRKRLPVPEDFAERVQRGERVKALAKVYGVAYGTVCRWRKEAGLVSGSPNAVMISDFVVLFLMILDCRLCDVSFFSC